MVKRVIRDNFTPKLRQPWAMGVYSDKSGGGGGRKNKEFFKGNLGRIRNFDWKSLKLSLFCLKLPKFGKIHLGSRNNDFLKEI